MSKSSRRDPSKPGIAGITADDLAALDGGRMTLADIGDRCGVSKAAAHRRVIKLRKEAPPASPQQGTAPSNVTSDPIRIDAHAVAISACLGLLDRSHRILVGPDAVGPTNLKALSATITAATAELRLLGELGEMSGDGLTEFVIRTMTDADVAEAQAEAALGDPDDHLDPDDQDRAS